MRRPSLRHVLVPLTAVGLLVSSCASTTANRRTTTITSVVTGSGPAESVPSSADSGAPTSGSGITVVEPSPSVTPTPTASASSSAPASTSEATTSSEAPTSTAETSAPVNKNVDPLKADCSALLNAGDIKKVLGVEVPTAINRIRDAANPERGVTGKIRCLYGVKGDDWAVVVGLTKYNSAAAAAKQVQTTVEFETDKGAVATETTVNGYPANVLLRDGGLIVTQYGTWTVGLAVKDGLLKGSDEEQAEMLEKAAELVMTRLVR